MVLLFWSNFLMKKGIDLFFIETIVYNSEMIWIKYGNTVVVILY
jgi:hypothetical protein